MTCLKANEVVQLRSLTETFKNHQVSLKSRICLKESSYLALCLKILRLQVEDFNVASIESLGLLAKE